MSDKKTGSCKTTVLGVDLFPVIKHACSLSLPMCIHRYLHRNNLYWILTNVSTAFNRQWNCVDGCFTVVVKVLWQKKGKITHWPDHQVLAWSRGGKLTTTKKCIRHKQLTNINSLSYSCLHCFTRSPRKQAFKLLRL